MKKVRLVLLFAIVTALCFVVYSCKKDYGGSPTSPAGNDIVLINIGNNIILPSYQSFAASVNALDLAVTAFNAGPTDNSLSDLQTAFKTAYKGWQSVSAYNYLELSSTLPPLLTSLNIFPTSTSLIEKNITDGNIIVNSFANTAARGFPALDYLLFSADNATILNRYTTDANASNRRQYLAAVSADVKVDANTAANAWGAGNSNFVKTFVSNTGNSISSSLGLLINSLVQDIEIGKNNRLGVPLGKIPIGTTSPVQPGEVEALYSGISVQLALAQLKTLQGIYLGTAANGNGSGLSTYLVKAKATYHNGQLSDTIRVAFENAVSDLQAVPDPLSQTIQTNPAAAQKVFADYQKLVTLLKTDMASSLGVLITFGDNDGD